MSCYRVTGHGIWTKLSVSRKQFNFLRAMDIYNKILNCEDKFTHLDQRCKGFLLNEKENISFSLKLKTWLLLVQHIDTNKKSLENKVSSKLLKIKPFNKIQSNLFRFIVNLLSVGMVISRWLSSKICGFLFNALHLFDINRYYIYYKGKFYRFFKIKIYKDQPK